MITGRYKEDVVRVAEKLIVAFSVEYVKSAPNTKRWDEAMQNSFEIAKSIVKQEYEFLNIKQ